MSALAAAPTGADEADQHQDERLFEMPAVTIDESNPTQITLAFSGTITLDRSQTDDVALYNRLASGKLFDLNVSGFVKGANTVHRRDTEGNIDAVAQTKSLVIDSIMGTAG